jgi:hypothetical protein
MAYDGEDERMRWFDRLGQATNRNGCSDRYSPQNNKLVKSLKIKFDETYCRAYFKSPLVTTPWQVHKIPP